MVGIKVSAMCKVQVALISRGDDCSHLRFVSLTPHPTYGYAGEMTVEWSKNVMDERDCPPQILLGSDDTDFCVLLGLAVYMEKALELGEGAAGRDAWLFSGDHTERGPKKALALYGRVLRAIYKSVAFLALSALIGGLLGLHSLRKFASTFAKRMGMTTDDVDTRGRWKGKGKGIVDQRYISPSQPFIDANVASALCNGLPCEYRVEADFVTDEWLLVYVVPFLHEFYGVERSPALLLAKPLLWAAMSPDMEGKYVSCLFIVAFFPSCH